MTVKRAIGLETEFGIVEPGGSRDVIEESNAIVEAYGAEGSATSRRGAIMFSYRGEEPLSDARGFRLERSQADLSLLTDDPNAPAPSAGEPTVARPSAAELAAPRTPNAVLRNGGRLYVDHAHPEYSSPETVNPREAVLWDRAGEELAREAMGIVARWGRSIVLYKNNVDGKGAAYGSHENYLVDRDLPFADLVRYMTPFLVTRPILCGAGRLGLGPHSEYPGFQISQRADYIETEVGLQTTFNRPVINTRDEPHAEATRYRRFHVINGDANQFDVSTLLKVGTTSLVLWMLERGELPLELDAAVLSAPVAAARAVSRDLTLREPLVTAGEALTALDIQQIYLDAVLEALEEEGEPDWDTNEVLTRWQRALDGLRTDPASLAGEIEWIGKYQLLNRARERGGVAWDAPKLRALDLQWHDLRRDRSVVAKLDGAGRVERLFTDDEVRYALTAPPESTRAYLRGSLVDRFPEGLAAAGWEEIIADTGGDDLAVLPMPEPLRYNRGEMGDLLDGASSIADVLAAVRRE